MKKIETDRLIVRNFREDDWADLYEYISKEEVRKYEPHWEPSIEACKKAAENFSKGDTFWAAQLKESGKMIGHVYFSKSEPERFRTWELGYVFNPEFQGKGYATEACKAVLQYGFDKFQVHRVVASCNPENTPSWRLMERLLMRFEGKNLKCVTFYKNDDGTPIWWDGYQYAILEEEWPKFECEYYDEI